MQFPRLEVFKTQLGEALSSLVSPQSWPCHGWGPPGVLLGAIHMLLVLLPAMRLAGSWAPSCCSTQGAAMDEHIVAPVPTLWHLRWLWAPALALGGSPGGVSSACCPPSPGGVGLGPCLLPTSSPLSSPAAFPLETRGGREGAGSFLSRL